MYGDERIFTHSAFLLRLLQAAVGSGLSWRISSATGHRMTAWCDDDGVVQLVGGGSKTADDVECSWSVYTTSPFKRADHRYCVVEIADGVAGRWTTTSNGVESACSDACNLCPWWYKQKHYISGDNKAYIRQEVTLQRKYTTSAPGASWRRTRCVLGRLYGVRLGQPIHYSQSILYNRSHRKHIGIKIV